jgi:hypothetical protein
LERRRGARREKRRHTAAQNQRSQASATELTPNNSTPSKAGS